MRKFMLIKMIVCYFGENMQMLLSVMFVVLLDWNRNQMILFLSKSLKKSH